MVYLVLIVLGLCFGSFINAAVWRIHEQSKTKKWSSELSLTKGRSMCPHCKHELSAKDLIPVLSWVFLKGKCRYCKKPISIQYPLIEILTVVTFVVSYIYWPAKIQGIELVSFSFWLVLLIGLIALFVYDLKWLLLPNRIVYPLFAVAALRQAVIVASSTNPLRQIIAATLAVLVGGGLFWVLYQVSKGKWIGGGDVKLGFVLGLIVGDPIRSLMVIFIASCLGTLVALPFVLTKKLKSTSRMPFGPYLIVAAIIVQLAGALLISWYKRQFLTFY